ncbi:MAG: peptide ABC transporter permease [Thermoactinomycetaceae bacterium]|nr:peptide ABC transporter permease [Bacillota bacterium]MBO2532522.1 peptide ABC transporter permease [Thermoactinomycetaceae bacterium]
MREIGLRLRQNRLALAGLVLILIFLLMAVFAPLIAPYDPYRIDENAVLSPPSAEHPLGTDSFGRDVLSRMVYGARISFKVGLISVGIALAAGVLIGAAAGYYGRWVDAALSRVIDVLFSFPDILLALVIMAVLGASLTNVMIAIGIVYTPIFARITRGAVLEIKGSLFIDAARVLGAGRLTILRRHILPNVMAPIIVQTTLSLAFAILAEAALSFIGLGVEPDTPSWGIMLNEGKNWMEAAWWIAVFPGAAITLAVLGFNVLGDGLRDALDPRLRGERL